MDKVKLPVTEQLPPEKVIMSLSKEKKNLLHAVFGILLFIFVLVVVGIASWFILKSNKGVTNNSIVMQSPTSNNSSQTMPQNVSPSPRPLLPGPHTFSVSSKNAIISVKELYINSLATKIGDEQTFRLTLKDLKGSINSVTVNLITDKKSENHVLSLKSGTGADGIWEGTWKTNDTHDYTYKARITIKDGSGNHFIFTPAFR